MIEFAVFRNKHGRFAYIPKNVCERCGQRNRPGEPEHNVTIAPRFSHEAQKVQYLCAKCGR